MTLDETLKLVGLVIVVVALITFVGRADAGDYWLKQYHLNGEFDPPIIQTKRFVGYSDCRDRGVDNQLMLRLLNIKSGFECVYVE